MSTIQKLQQHQSAAPSRWRKEAEARLRNREWLCYSQRIAMQMLDKMEAENMTQKQLAERMGCSQQSKPYKLYNFINFTNFITFYFK